MQISQTLASGWCFLVASVVLGQVLAGAVPTTKLFLKSTKDRRLTLFPQPRTDTQPLKQSKGLRSADARIFVADISPQYNRELVHELETRRPDDPGNISTVLTNPLGELLDVAAPGGLRQHYYYSLEVWLHQQLLWSPLRVYELKEADIIFLPIYLGIAQKLVIELGHQQTTELLERFWLDYSKSDSFQSQIPHWIALSDIELLYQAGCGGWGTNFLCRKEQKLPSALAISSPEIFLGPNPRQPLDFTRAFKGQAPNADSVTVPYMGHVHWTPKSLRRQQTFNAKATVRAKQYLAAASFVPKNTLRTQLMNHCMGSNPRLTKCKFISPTKGTRTGFNYTSIQQVAGQAWYCLQPPGDTPTRAAIFDCLMAGAIPVFFDPLITELLPFGDKIPWKDIITILPDSGTNPIEVLSRIPTETRLEQLRRLHDAQPILQYSSDPDHSQIQFGLLDVQMQQDDAFTSTVKAVLHNLCRRHFMQDRCNLTQPYS